MRAAKRFAKCARRSLLTPAPERAERQERPCPDEPERFDGRTSDKPLSTAIDALARLRFAAYEARLSAMRHELRAIVQDNWFQPISPASPRQLTFAEDLDALEPAGRQELAEIYRECFPEETPSQPDDRELERFLQAIMLVEYTFDDIGLLPPELRAARWRSAAEELGWSADRLMKLDSWWYSSTHHREFPGNG
jgi:hypothetical protein